MRHTAFLTGLIVVSALGAGTVVHAGDRERGLQFAVTVTNLTRGQTFTPVLVASHREGVTLFTPGQAPSPELAVLAEEGDVTPLTALLLSSPLVRAVANSGNPPGGFVGPGQSKTVVVDAGRGADHISVAAMLIPTNDGFFALNGVRAPRGSGRRGRPRPHPCRYPRSRRSRGERAGLAARARWWRAGRPQRVALKRPPPSLPASINPTKKA